MGLLIELKDEFGTVERSVSAPVGLSLTALLPGPTPGQLLSYIDPWGDTIFNRNQMNDFLVEWKALVARPEFAGHEDFAAEVEEMVAQCQSEVHLYLWFIGD